MVLVNVSRATTKQKPLAFSFSDFTTGSLKTYSVVFQRMASHTVPLPISTPNEIRQTDPTCTYSLSEGFSDFDNELEGL